MDLAYRTQNCLSRR